MMCVTWRHAIFPMSASQSSLRWASSSQACIPVVISAGHGPSVEYKGVKLHEPAKWHVYWGEGLAALMW